MANIKSQIKRNRQNEQARERNKAVKSEIRTRVKTAVTKGVIHKNQGANRKSGLMKRLNALKTNAS